MWLGENRGFFAHGWMKTVGPGRIGLEVASKVYDLGLILSFLVEEKKKGEPWRVVIEGAT